MNYSSFYKGKNCKDLMKRVEVKLDSKRAQLTTFIILGLIIISTLLIFFLYIKPTFFSSSGQLSVDACVNEVVKEKISDLSLTGGVINPQFKSMYMDENYTFICYTDEYYKPCVVQVPFLTSEFEKNLNEEIKDEVKSCYQKSIRELESKGYEVFSGDLKVETLIQPEYVLIKISSPTVVSSQDSSRSFDSFNVKLDSNLYEVLAVANSILQYETTYGDTDTSTYMAYYPNLIIDKIRRDRGIKLYTIENKDYIKFRFAIRSYAWPPGFG